MPRYDWKCKTTNCLAVVEVLRPMSEYNVPPRGSCPLCNKGDWAPKLSVPQVCISGGGSATTPFPIRTRGLPHRAKDATGREVVIRDDVVFNSKKDQDEYMNRHGLARYCDGEDSAVTDSQHSVFTQGDTPAPSARAAQFAQQSFFVEEADLHSLL